MRNQHGKRTGIVAGVALLLVTICGSAAIGQISVDNRHKAVQYPVVRNVTLTCYWVSNYQYSHSTDYVTLNGMTGTLYPDTPFTVSLRGDFVGPMDANPNWLNLTPRQQMSVRNMGWGQVDFGDGKSGGPNGAWGQINTNGVKTPIRGIWYLYMDHDLTPGAYPKIQLWPQTRPANWYQGFKQSYDQVSFPVMTHEPGMRVVANTGWLPLGTVLKITKGKNVLDFHAANAFLQDSTFEVLDIGAGGVHLDINMGLQYFEAEQMESFGIWLPGQTAGDSRGATVEILGQYTPDGVFHPQ